MLFQELVKQHRVYRVVANGMAFAFSIAQDKVWIYLGYDAFDPITGAFLGALNDPIGNPLSIDGLWSLRVGNGGNGGDLNSLFLAAGIDGERHGLFGRIASAPESGRTLMLLMTALAAIGCIARRWLHPQCCEPTRVNRCLQRRRS